MPRHLHLPISVATAAALVGLALLVGCGDSTVSLSDIEQQAEADGVDCGRNAVPEQERVDACASWVQELCGKNGEASKEFCKKAKFLVRENVEDLEIDRRSTRELKELEAEEAKEARREEAEKPTGPAQAGEMVGGKVNTIGLMQTINVRLKNGRVVTAKIRESYPAEFFEVGSEYMVQPTGNGWVFVAP